MFGGDDSNDSSDRANDLMETQIRQNDVELETKRKSLAQQRINIIKSQSSQNWGKSNTM